MKRAEKKVFKSSLLLVKAAKLRRLSEKILREVEQLRKDTSDRGTLLIMSSKNLSLATNLSAALLEIDYLKSVIAAVLDNGDEYAIQRAREALKI